MTRLFHSSQLIGAIALSILLLAASWGAVAWMLMQTVSLREAVSSAHAALDAVSAKTGNSETLNAALRDTTAERATIAQESGYAPLDIVNEIRSIASDAGIELSIDTIEPATLPGEPYAPALAVSMSAHDSFARLYRFVELLETSAIPLEVNQVSFDQLATAPSVPWTLQARVSVYTENAQSQ